MIFSLRLKCQQISNFQSGPPAYDDVSRLTSANCGTAAAQNFTYDPFGNINKSGSPYSFQPMYSSTTNRMTSVGGCTPAYDGDGNATNDCLHTYTWNSDGRPTTIDSVNLTYDALGRMVEQNRSGAYTEFVFAPTGFNMEIMNGQTAVKQFVPLVGGVTAVYTNGTIYFRHPDWLGSSRFVSTYGRTMYYDGAYAPFGEPYAQAGTSDLSFTGQRQDTVSGLYDFPAREYSIQGRWPSPDPAGLAAVDPSNPQSWNRYAYALNNPLALTDPDGLDPCQGANNFAFSQAANGTGIFTQDDCSANGGTWGDSFLTGGGNTPSGNGPTFGADNTPGCVPVQTDPLGNAPPSLNCNTDGSSGKGPIASGNTSGGFFSGILNRTKTVNRCAGQLSQAGSVTNLSGGRVPELLGSNTFGDVASLATGSGGLDQGAALADDATAHALPSIGAQVAIGTMTSVGTAISHTSGVYNPVTVGVTTARFGATTVGKLGLGALEGVLTGKVLLDAGVYFGALVVCSIQ